MADPCFSSRSLVVVRLVCCLAFNADGTKLAAVSGDDHHMLGVWDVATGSLVVRHSTNSNFVVHLPLVERGIDRQDWSILSLDTRSQDKIQRSQALHLI